MADIFFETLFSYTLSILPWLAVGSLVAYIVEQKFSGEKIRSYLYYTHVWRLPLPYPYHGGYNISEK